MQQESGAMPTWRALSNELASAVEKAGRAVVAVHGRRRIPSSGVHWRPGVVVTADHALERDEEITVTLPGGPSVGATLAGRDATTDVAVLKVEGLGVPVAEFADAASLKPGHWALAVGRTSEGGDRASLAMVGVVGPGWKTWRGGQLDQTIRLDRRLHPNFSGGPVVDEQGRVLGISTPAFSRFASVVVPASTVNRVADELGKAGHVRRGYLGIGMIPIRLPRKLRDALKVASESGAIVIGVEPESPADIAGVVLGDLLVALDAVPIRDIDDVQAFLSAERIGQGVKASIIRGGKLTELSITVSDRPAAN